MWLQAGTRTVITGRWTGLGRVLFVALAVVAFAVSSSHGERAQAGIPVSPRTGDVDCDASIDSRDAALVLQHSAGLLVALPCQINAIVDGYFPVTAVDATLILQYAAGLVDQLPPILEFSGTVAVVRGVEADCLALDTGSDQLVLLDPSGLSVGQRVSVTGFIDPFVSFCGVSPLLHNISHTVDE